MKIIYITEKFVSEYKVVSSWQLIRGNLSLISQLHLKLPCISSFCSLVTGYAVT